MARLLQSPKGLIGFLVLALIIGAAVGADVVSPHDPFSQSLRARLQPPLFWTDRGLYLLGTDQVGRDILSRIIHGARISLMVGISAVFVSGILGTLIGLAAGFYGGMVGATLMRIADIKLAMPMILFAIAWIAFFGPGLVSVIIIIGLWGWVPYARYSRGMVLFPEHEEFSTSAVREGCAEVRDVFVVRPRRRLGVATGIMQGLEEAVREQGLRRAGLAVGLDEEAAPARALYERLGYRHAHGPFVSSTNLIGEEGPVAVGAVMDYLVKDL